LVQAARSWWKKFTTVLKEKLKFQQHENDSCLLKRIDATGKVLYTTSGAFSESKLEEIEKILNQ
jgi:hypothetical protein